MAKIRKTRKEKVRGDGRRKIAVTSESPTGATTPSSVFTITPSSSARSSTPVTTSSTYNFLTQDLVKTAILTGSIIIAELVLAFIIKI